MKTCKTCAWYCHADECCYGTEPRLYAIVPASKALIPSIACEEWTFDGLEDWEREDCQKNALMTMEQRVS